MMTLPADLIRLTFVLARREDLDMKSSRFSQEIIGI